MREEYAFYTEDATVANIDELSRVEGRVTEQKLLELADIAASAADFSATLLGEGLGIYEVLSLVSDGLTLGEGQAAEDTLPEHLADVTARARELRGLDRAMLCRMLCERMSEIGRPLSEREFLPADITDGSVIYVRNQFADEAFDVFSVELNNPKVGYAAGFRDCAQAVSEGRAGYCLLPLEERGGTRLPTVAELIYRYDFKINSVTPVFGYDAGADLKYALVSKHFTVPPSALGDDRYIELRLGASAETSLSELLSAAAFLGMSVYRINTVTLLTEGEESTFFSMVLRDGGRVLTPFLCYVTLFAPDLVPVGVYKNLE